MAVPPSVDRQVREEQELVQSAREERAKLKAAATTIAKSATKVVTDTNDNHEHSSSTTRQRQRQQVESSARKLPGEKQETFQEHQGDFAYFIDYYRSPSFKKFWKFFIRAPIWAMAATASLLINFLKFR